MKFHHYITFMTFFLFYNNLLHLSVYLHGLLYLSVCLSVIIYTVHATTRGDWTQIPHLVSTVQRY